MLRRFLRFPSTTRHLTSCRAQGPPRHLVIVVGRDIQGGAPVFGGTRVPIQNLFDYIEEGDFLDVFLGQFPSVSRDMAIAVLEQARHALLGRAHTA